MVLCLKTRESRTLPALKKIMKIKSSLKSIKKRPGERYASALTSMNLSNKVYKLFGKIHLKDYVKNIIKSS